MPGKTRFFCDHCGAEVQRDTARCPQCGRGFASVRCPRCDFAGEEGLFSNGCPACGYSASPEGRLNPPLKKAASLPLWVYLISAFALIAVCVLLVWIVVRR